MISDVALTIFIIAIAAILSFIIVSLRRGNARLIHKLYFILAAGLMIWLAALIGISLTDPNNMDMMFIWDSITYLGGPFGTAWMVLISLVFVKGLDHLPGRYLLFLIPPAIVNILVWTNPLHHLIYQVFDIDSSKIVFGPLMFVSGAVSYCYLASAVAIMIRFAVKSSSKLYMRQGFLFAIGALIPLVVNMMATFKIGSLGIEATPLAFTATIILHGFAIFYFHMLDIKPLAMQRVLDRLSDCYLVISDTGLVVNFNWQFQEVFGKKYGIQENTFLQDSVQVEDADTKSTFYNLTSSIETCRETMANISYEQSVFLRQDGELVKKYFMVEITPLLVEENKLGGFLAFFKDVTKVKESMQRLQDSQTKLMEQERLASLGQMVGGIAHNLKTPIMSVSGSMIAVENLVEECQRSLGDPEVTPEDYREIYQEIDEWVNKVREACSYMSEIITAVKGQAVNMSRSETEAFAVSDAMKRVALLLRHELVGSGCKLEIKNSISQDVILQGDINSMVQVVNNLVTNAVDAEKGMGGGVISILLEKTGEEFLIKVKDTGAGVPEDVKKKLFKQMITSKGAMGNGLGIYISNSVIKAKFNGRMWMEDNPEGGAIFGIAIPLQYVTFAEFQKRGDAE